MLLLKHVHIYAWVLGCPQSKLGRFLFRNEAYEHDSGVFIVLPNVTFCVLNIKLTSEKNVNPAGEKVNKD